MARPKGSKTSYSEGLKLMKDALRKTIEKQVRRSIGQKYSRAVRKQVALDDKGGVNK